jgi:hypothetical protein
LTPHSVRKFFFSLNSNPSQHQKKTSVINDKKGRQKCVIFYHF